MASFNPARFCPSEAGCERPLVSGVGLGDGLGVGEGGGDDVVGGLLLVVGVELVVVGGGG